MFAPCSGLRKLRKTIGKSSVVINDNDNDDNDNEDKAQLPRRESNKEKLICLLAGRP